MEDSGITVLRRVRQLIHTEVHWQLRYIPREHNSIADHLAKLRLTWKSSLQILDAIPERILELLQLDKGGSDFGL